LSASESAQLLDALRAEYVAAGDRFIGAIRKQGSTEQTAEYVVTGKRFTELALQIAILRESLGMPVYDKVVAAKANELEEVLRALQE
jgi:hypothetical protein